MVVGFPRCFSGENDKEGLEIELFGDEFTNNLLGSDHPSHCHGAYVLKINQ